eukprot:4055423-Karenia_brevis.AAC.1
MRNRYESMPERVAILEEMFAKAGLDMVGPQEGRLKGEGKHKGIHYDMYRAAAENGRGGVQFWVRQAAIWSVEKVVVRSPWLMRVTLCKSGVTIHCVVGHAPIEDATPDVKCAFQEMLDEELELVSKDGDKAAKLLLVDANAGVGAITGPSIGP